jgi:hypothetical protein
MPWKRDPETGEFIESAEFDRRKAEKLARSKLPFPMVRSDYLPDVKSMVSGKHYDSKSALRAEYRAKGYIEVGNESFKDPPKPKPDRKAIRNTVGKALNRVGISVDG